MILIFKRFVESSPEYKFNGPFRSNKVEINVLISCPR